MANRRPAPTPDRDGEPSAADGPLVDLIFPNRGRPRGDTTTGSFRPAHNNPVANPVGASEPAKPRHSRATGLARLLRRGAKAKKVRVAPGIGGRPVPRRPGLLRIGTGV